MKRVMEDERYAAARTDRTFRPMRRKEAKVALGSKTKRVMEDERFTAARTDPRFRSMRRKEARLALDSRFTPMLTDPLFDSSVVDKRGRCRKKSARDRKNPMLHYYLNEDEEDEDDQYSVGCDIAHHLMSSHDDAHVFDKETHRLAVVNMDWDHIKAADLYMVMTSCIPKGGQVLSVSIYPTEFGLKCMNIETTEGPSALIGADGYGGDDGGEDVDNDDGCDDGEEDDLYSETENKQLCTCGLNKRRYYYAVVVCDSSATADHLYTSLDGTEFLKTANVFDLQFIYDSMEFKYPACDVATEHTKDKPTWDDDGPVRNIVRKKFERDEFNDPYDYVESDESASEDGVSKWKLIHQDRLALLLDGNESDEERRHDQDMEINFNMELEDISKRILERKDIETKAIWEMHQGKMEKQKARKRWSKDDDDYSNKDSADDFLDEKLDEQAKPMKKPKVKAKGKGKTSLQRNIMSQKQLKRVPDWCESKLGRRGCV